LEVLRSWVGVFERDHERTTRATSRGGGGDGETALCRRERESEPATESVSHWVRLPTDPCYRQEYLRPLHLLLRLLCNSPIASSAWLCPYATALACSLSLSLSLSLTRSHVRSLGRDAASCSCRCWPCAALARLCLARTFPVPPSPPSRFSFASISLSSRQALVAQRHQAAPLPLGCSLPLVQHHIHHYCTCHTFAFNQSINQSINHLGEGF